MPRSSAACCWRQPGLMGAMHACVRLLVACGSGHGLTGMESLAWTHWHGLTGCQPGRGRDGFAQVQARGCARPAGVICMQTWKVRYSHADSALQHAQMEVSHAWIFATPIL